MSDAEAKRCPDCDVTKPLVAFPRNRTTKDGHGTYCKECFAVRYRLHREKKAAAAGRTIRHRRVLPEGTAYCPRCDDVLPLDCFGVNAGARNGRTAYCLPCHNEVTREARIRKHGSTRDFHLKRRYGLTSADVDAMVAAQGGRCALCDERDPQHVDHHHVTGEVRGVLCSCCNQGLGNFRDRPDLLAAGVAYLHRTRPQVVRVERGVYAVTAR